MKVTSIQITLTLLWLLSFVLCLAIPLYARRDIPESFSALIKQAFDTFGPGLATMLAFVFQNGAKKSTSLSPLALWVAPVLATVYVGFFDLIMVSFVRGGATGADTVSLFQEYRPYLSFLVTGMLAYYFHNTRRAA